MSITADPNDPGINKDRGDGQNETYLVLSVTEREKGFVRPVRRSYIHKGPKGPQYPLADLTEEQRKLFGAVYVKFEKYPEGETSAGRYWTEEQLDRVARGCGALTTMHQAIAETYARNPKFYGATFCCACGAHYPVAEFVWDGTDEVVGS